MNNSNKITIISLCLAAFSCVLTMGIVGYLIFSERIPNPPLSRAGEEVIRTKKLIIVDDQEKEHLTLMVDAATGAMVKVGADSSSQVILYSGKDGDGIKFIDAQKNSRVHFARNANDQIYLNLFSNKRKNTFQILADDKESKITLASNNDERKIGLGVTNSMSGLVVLDESNVTRFGLYYQNDHTNMMMYDRNGRQRFVLSLLKHKPQFAMFDSEQRPRLSLMLHNNQPTFEFYDATGGIRFKLMEEKNDPIMAFLDNSKSPMLTMGVDKGNPLFSVNKDQLNLVGRLPD